MCSPLLVAGASGGAQLFQGLQQRDAVQQHNAVAKVIAEREEANAIAAAVRDAKVFARKESQVDSQTSLQARRTAIQGAILKGQSRSGSGASGVEGISVDTIESDFQVQETLAQSAIEKQREFGQEQIQNEKDQLVARTQGRIAAAAPNLQPVPSLLGTLIQVGTSALSGYAMGKSFTN